jgi:hypothetical protein
MRPGGPSSTGGDAVPRGPGSWLDRLVGACFSLLVAAIAFAVAVSIIRPYLTLLAVAALAVLGVVAWRSWQRSRW